MEMDELAFLLMNFAVIQLLTKELQTTVPILKFERKLLSVIDVKQMNVILQFGNHDSELVLPEQGFEVVLLSPYCEPIAAVFH
jgi:hypothetical protein